MSDKKISKNIYLNKEHTWAKKILDKIKIGITDHAQEELGEIEFVELPQTGKKVKQAVDKGTEDSKLATVESIKSTSEVYSPVSGKVTEVNEDLEMNPELINDDPYGEGWICILEPTDLEELEKLLDLEDYEKYIRSKD